MAQRFFILVLAFCFLLLPKILLASDENKAIVFIIAEFANGDTEFATGFFVDHDGLVVTADHVIHKYAAVPSDPTSRPIPRATARKISVYSWYLKKHFEVDLSEDPKQIVTGQELGEGRWLDLAFIRVRLSDNDSEKVRPLDITEHILNQGDFVGVYGPTCEDANKQKCLVPMLKAPLTISNILEQSGGKEYTVSALLQPSFSGGPLVDPATEKAAGVCSYGERLPRQQNLTYINSYVPAHFIKYLSLPYSSFFSSLRNCATLQKWEEPTWFDVYQFANTFKAILSEPECHCLCLAAGKKPTAVPLPAQKKFLRCAPPWCKVNLAYAALLRLQAASVGDGLDQQSAESWFTFSQLLYADLVEEESTLNPRVQVWLHKSYGDFFYAVADGTIRIPSTILVQNADDLSLHAYSHTLEINKNQPDVWRSTASLLNRQGESETALAALVVAKEHGLHYRGFISDFSYIGARGRKQEIRPTDRLLPVASEVH